MIVSELASLSGMNAGERLQYFLTRSIEAEEIWGLADASGWVLREEDGQTILQVWPYAQLASDYAHAQQEHCQPEATSLEHFVYNLLNYMAEQVIAVEILPHAHARGHIIPADKLYELFDGMLESGEYYLEG